jgi:hypothetical protein
VQGSHDPTEVLCIDTCHSAHLRTQVNTCGHLCTPVDTTGVHTCTYICRSAHLPQCKPGKCSAYLATAAHASTPASSESTVPCRAVLHCCALCSSLCVECISHCRNLPWYASVIAGAGLCRQLCLGASYASHGFNRKHVNLQAPERRSAAPQVNTAATAHLNAVPSDCISEAVCQEQQCESSASLHCSRRQVCTALADLPIGSGSDTPRA